MAQSLHKLEINNNEQELKASFNSTNNFLQKLQAMSFEFIALANKSEDNLNEKEHQALNNLAKDKTIVVSKADKGNTVAIQDLAKYLVKILTPLIKGNAQVIKDTNDFVNKVSKLNLGKDKYIVSFDLESLFTNIPTKETIVITLKLALQ